MMLWVSPPTPQRRVPSTGQMKHFCGPLPFSLLATLGNVVSMSVCTNCNCKQALLWAESKLKPSPFQGPLKPDPMPVCSATHSPAATRGSAPPRRLPRVTAALL